MRSVVIDDMTHGDLTIEGDPGATIALFGGTATWMFRIAANNLTFRNINFVGGRPMTTNFGTGAFIKVLLTSTPGSLASNPVLVNNQGGSGYVPDAGYTYFDYTVTDNHDPMMAAAVIQCEVVSGRITSDGMATWSNLTFENCFFKFGRSALRLNNTRDVRILDCRFEDQGPDASPIDLIDTSQALVRGNRVYRPVGVANDGECARREARLQGVVRAA